MTIANLRFGDFFSGISCPATALKKMGIKFNYVFACEIDKIPTKVLKANFDIENFYDDVKKITSLPQVDLFVAGFPCQGYSAANTMISTESHQSYGLWRDAVRGITESKCQWFLLENVKALTFSTHSKHLKEITDELDKLEEYSYKIRVYNSKDHGTPQSRPRVWFIGWRKWMDEPKDLLPIPLKETLLDIVDINLPMKPFVSKSSHFNKLLSGLIDSVYINTGQSTGSFSKLDELGETTTVPCILKAVTRNGPHIIVVSNGQSTGSFSKLTVLNETEISSNIPKSCNSNGPFIYAVSNGHGGKTDRITERDDSYTTTKSTVDSAFEISQTSVKSRLYTSTECERFFGLNIGDYDYSMVKNTQYMSCLGNGMDVGILMRLIGSLINEYGYA